jgi:phosphoribosylformimino-5-aminoimidazole carboxamide ribotide isomerase
MLIFPAIDLRAGRVVRLAQGDYDRMTVYAEDPAEVAQGFVRSGAKYLHTVDLDGARDGNPQNRAAIRELCRLPLFVELGGGIRTQADVENAFSLGVSRVILGTMATEDFPLTQRLAQLYGDKIAVGVDVKDGRVAVRGWREMTDFTGYEFCQKLADTGISTIIYTDISRDGLLMGANLTAYEELQSIGGLNVIASGGIAFEREIAALRRLGTYGVIVGKALYTGKLSLARVLKIAQGEEPAC